MYPVQDLRPPYRSHPVTSDYSRPIGSAQRHHTGQQRTSYPSWFTQPSPSTNIPRVAPSYPHSTPSNIAQPSTNSHSDVRNAWEHRATAGRQTTASSIAAAQQPPWPSVPSTMHPSRIFVTPALSTGTRAEEQRARAVPMGVFDQPSLVRGRGQPGATEVQTTQEAAPKPRGKKRKAVDEGLGETDVERIKARNKREVRDLISRVQSIQRQMDSVSSALPGNNRNNTTQTKAVQRAIPPPRRPPLKTFTPPAEPEDLLEGMVNGTCKFGEGDVFPECQEYFRKALVAVQSSRNP